MASKTSITKTTKAAKPTQPYESVHGGIVDLLQSARVAAARSVNALMTASYWEIGRRIVEAEQGGSARAGYGEQLIQLLAVDLTAQFGRGFSRQNLQQMRQFYSLWPICQTPSGKLQIESKILQTVSAKSFSTQITQTLSAKSRIRQTVQA